MNKFFGGRRVCARLTVVLSLVLTFLVSRAQSINSWKCPTSGNWEDMNWSSGTLPQPTQTILVTNHGWKAVAIGPNTALDFPQTMTIKALYVTSPGTDTVNTVLLNYVGIDRPLIASSVTVGYDAALVMLQSALLVTNGSLNVDGVVTHGASSQVTLDELNLHSTGVYNMSNGTLNTAWQFPAGQFRQQGGSNSSEYFGLTGEYDLSGGDLLVNGSDLAITGTFIQSGGTSEGVLDIGRSNVKGGRYELYGGIHRGTLFALPATGSGPQSDQSYAVQGGGTNFAGTMNVGAVGASQFLSSSFGMGNYTLTNGMLISASLAINGHGVFSQSGGVHSNTSMSFSQSPYYRSGPGYYYTFYLSGQYSIDGGMLTSELVDMSPGSFSQTGGSCQFGELRVNGGAYTLSGGQLTVSNMIVGAVFNQTGGTLTQSGTLTLGNASFTAGPGAQQFGRLQLSGDTNSSFLMPTGACVLHFANSSAMVWSNAPSLTIEKWAGSLSGGGMQQIIFGSSNAALASTQLNHIKFHNPVGVTAGLYPAVILPNGEMIPDPKMTLSKVAPPALHLSSQTGGGMQIQLQGAAGRSYMIEVSSNLAGWAPWTNAFNTNGTCTVNDSDAANCLRRFYRAVLQP